MAHRKTERNPLFAGRWFEDDIILLCLRWYFRFKLSYRDLAEILGERGLSIYRVKFPGATRSHDPEGSGEVGERFGCSATDSVHQHAVRSGCIRRSLVDPIRRSLVDF